jgi:hypothetical protein
MRTWVLSGVSSDASPVLNTVPLGLVSRALTSPDERAKLFAATVEHDGEIVAAALRSDFPKMTLAAAGTEAALVDLARLVHSRMPELPCVLGRDFQVAAFAAEWEGLAGRPGRPGAPQGVHEGGEMPSRETSRRNRSSCGWTLARFPWRGRESSEKGSPALVLCSRRRGAVASAMAAR